jgi:hypothetical protein
MTGGTTEGDMVITEAMVIVETITAGKKSGLAGHLLRVLDAMKPGQITCSGFYFLRVICPTATAALPRTRIVST